jgi:hypothetical protein
LNWRAALRPIYLSFYSAPFYREVGRELEGHWFGYLFFLVALCSIPGVTRGYGVISDFFGTEVPAVIRQVPPVRIEGGTATIVPPGPHIVYNPADNSPMMILDTSGRFSSLDNTDASMLLTRDRMIVRKSARETRVFPLSALDNGVVDEALLDSWRTSVWNWITVLYFPLAVFLSFAFRTLQSLLLAVVGLLYARRIGAPLDYAASLRLAVFAATPAIVASAVRDALGVSSGLGTVLDFLIVLAYLHFAVRANANGAPRPTSA